jgi:Secretion system C-terminal sorting domain
VRNFKKKLSSVLIITLLFSYQITFSQTTFIKKYGDGKQLYFCNDLIKTQNYNYLIAGGIFDSAFCMGYVLEIDTLGNIVSEIKLKDSIYQSIYISSISEYNNTIYSAGRIAFSDNFSDYYTTNINAFRIDGTLLWRNIISNSDDDDIGVKIKVKNNTVHVLSNKNIDLKNSRINIIKTDTLGNQIFNIDIWDTTYKYNSVYDFEILNDSSYYILGYREKPSPIESAMWITKLNKNGDSIFSKDVITNNNDLLIPKKILLSAQNNLFVIGSVYINGQFPAYLFNAKLSESGDLVWYQIDTTTIGIGSSIIEKNNNAFIIAGNEASGMFVNKIDSNGSVKWSSKIGANFRGTITNIVTTNDGGFLISGNDNYNDSNALYKNYIFVIKLDSLGKIVFATKINPITKEIQKINIYPNPTNGIIHILNPNHTKYTSIQFYSLNGTLLKTYNGMDAEINISEFTNGEYLIKLNTAKEFFTKKIIKN